MFTIFVKNLEKVEFHVMCAKSTESLGPTNPGLRSAFGTQATLWTPLIYGATLDKPIRQKYPCPLRLISFKLHENIYCQKMQTTFFAIHKINSKSFNLFLTISLFPFHLQCLAIKYCIIRNACVLVMASLWDLFYYR